MKTRIYLFFACIGVAFGLSGCRFFQQRQLGEALVSVQGHALYEADLEAITANAVSSADSARLVNAYIQQWATDILLYDKAKKSASNPAQIDALAEDYRRSLYVYEYEQHLVAQKMNQQVGEDTIRAFYEAHPDRFILREPLLKGLLLVLPVDAPHTKKLRGWLQTLSNDNLEHIEKYAYQYATAYELFTDQWQTSHKLMMRIPMDASQTVAFARNQSLENLIQSSNNLIEQQDSLHLYLLRITDKRLTGQPMPLDYATPEITNMILSQRQVQFLDQQKALLYNNALKKGSIIFKTPQTNE